MTAKESYLQNKYDSVDLQKNFYLSIYCPLLYLDEVLESAYGRLHYLYILPSALARVTATRQRWPTASIEEGKVVERRDRSYYYQFAVDPWDSFTAPIRKEHPGFYREWVLMVPDTPMQYAPGDTLWHRVTGQSMSFCRIFYRILAYLGGWPLPVPIPPRNHILISVFLVPRSQYTQLDDSLTEIRLKNISKPPDKSPSVGGQASTSTPHYRETLGRPKQENFHPIPLSLLQPEFVQFKQDITSGPLDSDLSPLAYKWRNELLEINQYEKRNSVTIDLNDVMDLLIAPLLVKAQDELAQSTSDALFEIVLCYLEGRRHILTDDAPKGNRRKNQASLAPHHPQWYVHHIRAVQTTEVQWDEQKPTSNPSHPLSRSISTSSMPLLWKTSLDSCTPFDVSSAPFTPYTKTKTLTPIGNVSLIRGGEKGTLYTRSECVVQVLFGVLGVSQVARLNYYEKLRKQMPVAHIAQYKIFSVWLWLWITRPNRHKAESGLIEETTGPHVSTSSELDSRREGRLSGKREDGSKAWYKGTKLAGYVDDTLE
ncbi:hypothetical protein BDP27DRAFT_1370289 [Rhodocollybia butyracea]|uniref:Uncharacterized protein n=1 Tax=Rhodocollybia butyracea TaxID=206335 RepID=A0A9P5TZT4_9AGAR|nr:hypothetical protein BDP27DRAFT_1370289 [Rhodocollybia butyracea]